MKRMWINQPSTMQPLHHLHGTRVLADGTKVYLLDGPTISMEVPSLCLSEGWPAHDPIPSPRGVGRDQAHETVWACLHRLPEGALTETERDDLNTAMASLKEL